MPPTIGRVRATQEVRRAGESPILSGASCLSAVCGRCAETNTQKQRQTSSCKFFLMWDHASKSETLREDLMSCGRTDEGMMLDLLAKEICLVSELENS